MRRKILFCIAFIMLSGCAGEDIYSQKTKGRLEPRTFARAEGYKLMPAEQTQEQDGVKIDVQYLSYQKLSRLFLDKKTYGANAGKNPFPKELIVFKVRIENKSESRILINPDNFVLLDEMGTQYLYINPDYIMDIYKSKKSLYSFTKTTSALTSGIYGASIDFARSLTGRGWEKIENLLKSIELTGGNVYPGVIYDGFIAFLRPIPDAKDIRLLLSNIKTKFDVNDEALGSIDFVFNFKHE